MVHIQQIKQLCSSPNVKCVQVQMLMTDDKCSIVVHTIEDGRGAWDGCIAAGPGPDNMGAGCASGELDDGIIGGICSVCRCNIAYKYYSIC